MAKIHDKYVLFGILFLVISGGWLYFTQLRDEFQNPNVFYILEDRIADNNQLRITTRGADYQNTKELLLWRYDLSAMSLYRNQDLIAKSTWKATGYGLKQTTNGDSLSYIANQEKKLVLVTQSDHYNKGVLDERTTIDPKATFEAFPSEYLINWSPTDNYKYKLSWIVSGLALSDEIRHGRTPLCEIRTLDSVKISWCDEISNLDYAFIDKNKGEIRIYFLSKVGNQKLNVILTDPLSYVFGNVNENYLTDVNQSIFSPSIVDYNVAPKGQTDTNSYWRLSVSGEDSNWSVILLDRHYLFDFEKDWVNWKRVPLTAALLARSDSNAYRGSYSMRLPLNADTNYRKAIWTNNQFRHDIRDTFDRDGNIVFYLKTDGNTNIADINIVVGHTKSRHAWIDYNFYSDTNMQNNIWKRFDFDLNVAITKQVGTQNWRDINYFSIIVNTKAGYLDFNLWIDSVFAIDTNMPLPNWHNGTRFMVDTDNDPAGAFDINHNSYAFIVPSVLAGADKNIWLWMDANFTGYTPSTIFDFDFNWSVGGIPTAD